MSHARIGRVIPKVVPIRKDVAPLDDRKTRFIDHMALSYDKYVADFGVRPDAAVTVLGGLGQTLRNSWTMPGDTSTGKPLHVLALAHSTLGMELYSG